MSKSTSHHAPQNYTAVSTLLCVYCITFPSHHSNLHGPPILSWEKFSCKQDTLHLSTKNKLCKYKIKAVRIMSSHTISKLPFLQMLVVNQFPGNRQKHYI